MDNSIIKLATFGVLAVVFVFVLHARRDGTAQEALLGAVSPIVSPKRLVTPAPKIGDSKVSPKMSPIVSPISSPVTTVSPILSPSIQSTPNPTYSPLSSPSPLVTATPTVTNPTPPDDGHSDIGDRVVINEIAWMGTGANSSDEWLELYNASNHPISLEGWTLNSLTGSTPDPKIVLVGTIPAHGYALLERTDDNTVSDVLMFQKYTGALNDSGETLELRDSLGILKDSVPAGAGWFAGDKNNRSTMERIDPMISGQNVANWGTNNGSMKIGKDAGGGLINGTPGVKNSLTM